MIKNNKEVFVLKILRDEFSRRKKSNTMYSLRSFALNLNVDSSLLSKIMNEKLLPTLDTADKICKSLKLEIIIAKEFMKSISDEKTCLELHRIDPNYTDCE